MRIQSIVVGAGLMGRWHVAAIHRAGGQVVACVDPDVPRAFSLATSIRRCRVARTLAEALARGPADIVHICTPLATHAQLVDEAIGAGCHVIVEKPLAPDLATTRRLLAAAEARGVRLIAVHQFPFQAGLARILRTLPELGPLRLIECVICSAGAEARPLAADQIARDILPHPFSVLHRCFPGSLEAAPWQLGHTAPGEWHITTPVSGAMVSIHLSLSGRPPCNEMRLTGTRGRAHVDLFHGFAHCEPGWTGRGYKLIRPIALGVTGTAVALTSLARRSVLGDYAYPGLRTLIRACYASIRSGAASPVSPAELLAVAGAIDQVTAGLESPESLRNAGEAIQRSPPRPQG